MTHKVSSIKFIFNALFHLIPSFIMTILQWRGSWVEKKQQSFGEEQQGSASLHHLSGLNRFGSGSSVFFVVLLILGHTWVFPAIAQSHMIYLMPNMCQQRARQVSYPIYYLCNTRSSNLNLSC